MKKRIFSLALSALLVAAMATPAFAADGDITQDSTDQTKTVPVTYIAENKWTVSIPATVTLSDTVVVQQAITASAMNIQPEKVLNVSVLDKTADNASTITAGEITLSNKDDANITTTSKVSLTSAGEKIGVNAVVASFAGVDTAAQAGTGTLYYSALTANGGTAAAPLILAGEYTGTIIFQIAVADKPIL